MSFFFVHFIAKFLSYLGSSKGYFLISCKYLFKPLSELILGKYLKTAVITITFKKSNKIRYLYNDSIK